MAVAKAKKEEKTPTTTTKSSSSVSFRVTHIAQRSGTTTLSLNSVTSSPRFAVHSAYKAHGYHKAIPL